MKRKQQTVIVITSIVLFFLLLHYLRVLRPLEDAIVRGLYSITRIFYDNRLFSNSETTINTKLSSTIDPELLEAACTISTSDVALLREENEELRQQLEFFSRESFYTHIGAEVIGRTVDPLGTVLTINRGSHEGVIPTNPVIVGNGILVGTVIEVMEHASFIRLISDNMSKVGASLLNLERTIGLVEGGYGIGVRMNFIPQNEVVSPGDIVVTSGLTENMPRGLMIGKVEIVEKQPHEPFQQAILAPLADLSYLTTVSVITAIPSNLNSTTRTE